MLWPCQAVDEGREFKIYKIEGNEEDIDSEVIKEEIRSSLEGYEVSNEERIVDYRSGGTGMQPF